MATPQNLRFLWPFLLLHVFAGAFRFDTLKQNGEPQEGDLRLSGGESPAEGRVEVFHNGKWGTVCDDGWDMKEAQVVCRQLDFPGAKSVITGKSYKQASGPIWLDDITCNGNENSLVSCSFKGWGLTDCTHKEDVGVVCETGSNGLTNNTTTHSMDHSISLSNDLGQLFDTATNCDLNILLQSPTGNRQEDDVPEMVETTICAHKAILSLFPHFNVFPETTNITVEVRKPCQPYFSSLIRYLYTRKIDVTFSSALCLHQMASSFGVKQLMEDVGRLFTQIFPDDSSFYTHVSIYQYAVETTDTILEENLIQYLAWNYQNLTDSPAWNDLPVELLQALLARSDLVVPDESFVLETLESWITDRALLNSSDTVLALLSGIRFPMISAEKLLELESSSPLYQIYKNVYREFTLKAFQFNVLLFSNLTTNPNIKKDIGNYSPRIYISEPWSKVLREPRKPSPNPYPYQYQNQFGGSYNRYDRYGNYNSNPSTYIQSGFTTPLHNSLLFRDRKTSWEANVFTRQSDCSNRGVRCESVPAAMLRDQIYSSRPRQIRFSNRLLLMCQNTYIFQVQSFKDNMAYISKNDTQASPYPCVDNKYTYLFVVIPEYV
uniref:Zgc:112492 n=1 Tax=Oryzias latipes TaxID=8090 RepID=A0A3P9J6W6_ORYLA